MAEMLGFTVRLDTLGSTIFEITDFTKSRFPAVFAGLSHGLSHNGAIFRGKFPPASTHSRRQWMMPFFPRCWGRRATENGGSIEIGDPGDLEIVEKEAGVAARPIAGHFMSPTNPSNRVCHASSASFISS